MVRVIFSVTSENHYFTKLLFGGGNEF